MGDGDCCLESEEVEVEAVEKKSSSEDGGGGGAAAAGDGSMAVMLCRRGIDGSNC